MKYLRVFHPAGRCAVPIRSRRIGHGVLAPNAELRSEIIPDAQKHDHDIAKAQGDDPLSGSCPHQPGSVAETSVRVRSRTLPLHCGGVLKIIAAIEEPTVIAKILDYLGLPAGHLRCAVPASLAVQPSLIATLSMLRSKSRATLLVARS
jgi:hypothetical protein